MPKHVIKSDRTAQWVVNKDGHSWIIEKQAALEVDPGPAILIEDGFNKNRIKIDGDVIGSGASSSDATAISNDGDRNTFILGPKGKIQGEQGMVGTGDHTKFINHGAIATSNIGIAQNEDFTLVNDGSINGSYGVSVAQARLITNEQDGLISSLVTAITLFGDGVSTIVNKGLISSGFAAAIQDGDGAVTIRNSGTISGDLNLGGGNDILNSTKGEVNGEVHGGDGADIYRISQFDLVIVEELDQGKDAVYSTVSFTLSSNIEALKLTGRGNTAGAGNASNNEIVGNKGNNMLLGVGGDDVLIGGAGNDTLAGGADDDHFLFAKSFGKDVITDFEHGIDLIGFIQVSGLNDVGDVMSRLEQHGADVWIETNGGRLVLKGIDVGDLDANDFGVLHS